MPLSLILEKLYDLRRDRSSGHEKPYKPALILSILDLMDQGHFPGNQFPLTVALIDRYKSLIAIVGKPTDTARIEYPYYHLSGDGFWTLLPLAGEAPLYQEGQAGRSPSVKRLRKATQGGSFDQAFYQAFQDPIQRQLIRQSLIARYFPEHRDILERKLVHFLQTGQAAELDQADYAAARDPAFRKIILEQYDCTCAACRIRVKVKDLVIVDAAHLVPWSETQNDHPTNGLALCKNHHWAMDRHLIAPGPDHRWQVSPTLDPYSPALQPLIDLADRPLTAPKEKRFIPSEKALQWCLDRLAS